MTDTELQIIRQGVLDMQVCVPKDWSDSAILLEAEAQNPAGTRNGWYIIRDGDKALLGHPSRNECANNSDRVHLLLGV